MNDPEPKAIFFMTVTFREETKKKKKKMMQCRLGLWINRQ